MTTMAFIAENEEAAKEVEEAQKKLQQAQLQAEIAKKRREAQEAKRKSLQIQKQIDRENRRAEQERIRYEKAITRETVEHGKNNKECGDRTKISIKERVKTLNPLRRARVVATGTDGSNNPNIEGADNGGNAWLDSQLSELEPEVQHQARYAKQNSDTGRFFDIDDIPIRGPPKTEEFCSGMSADEAVKIAQQLMDDDNVSICNMTGIKRPKGSRRQPSSTVSMPSTSGRQHHRVETDRYSQHQSDNYRGRREHREQSWDSDRYDESNMEGWDTPSETGSDRMIEYSQKSECTEYDHCRPKTWGRNTAVRFGDRKTTITGSRAHGESSDDWHPRDNYRNKHRYEERERQ